jgi:tetratricopeptide (TPR) repeat protein
MKRSERHHLKENAFAVAVNSLRAKLEVWGRVLTIGIAIGLGVWIVYGGYSWWADRAESQAGGLLADALTLADAPVVSPPPAPALPPVVADPATGEAAPVVAPVPAAEFVQPPGPYPTIEAKMAEALPKLIEAADTYPGTQSGITARYRAASALAAIGRHDEAAEHYQQVIGDDGSGVYARMATLGLANVQVARSAYDEAIALLEQSIDSETSTELPVDGVLMLLAHAYDRAGRSEEARATLQRVIEEFPTSLYFTNAERDLEALQTES